MSAIAYVDGAYAPLARARVSILDRGFQFGDAVYEVWPVRGGRLVDSEGHLQRLWRSLAELRIAQPMPPRALTAVILETMRRNRVLGGIVYLQISRGAPRRRDHEFPPASVKPTIIVTARNLDQRALAARAEHGVNVITTPDIRWARRDIKSVNLLANVLAKQAAKEAGAFEAWFVDDDGFVTEGSSTNSWIVDAGGRLRTRALSNDILHGVTRAALLEIARAHQMPVAEEAFTVAEAQGAREAFLTSAMNPGVAVVAIDGKPIGDGAPGPVARRLRALYLGAPG